MTTRHFAVVFCGAVLVVAVAAGCTFESNDISSEGQATSTSTTEPSTEPQAPAPPGAVLQPVGARLEEVAKLDKPVAFAMRPGGNDVFIAEQGGRVKHLVPNTGERQPDEPPDDGKPFRVIDEPVLDISADVRNQGEQGLLGMTFSPDGRRLYVHYSGTNGDTQVVSYEMNAEGADLSTRRRVFSTAQPQQNHNGGQLVFGPDGYLYLGLGDGGGSGDPDSNAQNPGTVLGTVIRIDPDGATGDLRYSSPTDNPFAEVGGAPEVWLYGVRNPWRFSFDRLTGDLWLADVGEGDIEEVNWLPAQEQGAGRRANLGWPLYEGSRRFAGGQVAGEQIPSGLVAPVFEYNHDQGCSVTGGIVYRGSAIGALQGTYVFGDYCSPAIVGIRMADGAVAEAGPIGVNVNRTVSFGEDNNGELWILSHDGPVYRLLPA